MKTLGLTSITLALLLVIGCASTPIPYKEIPEIHFETAEPYKIDLDSIQKPSPPKAKYGKYIDNGDVQLLAADDTIDSAAVVVFDLNEYKKIGQLVVLTTTYKNIIEQQSVLINNKIEIENSLKELMALERMKTKEYADMWVDMANTYQREKHDHKMDNIMNKVTQMLLVGLLVGVSI